MTKALYMWDSYLKEFEANVVECKEGKLILDQTAFYPKGGGLESDKGKIVWKDKEFEVKEVKKEGSEIIHLIDGEIKEGEKIKGIIDWDWRYKMMKLHTLAHIISAILYKKWGVLITGNHIGDKGRIDFNLEGEDWKEKVKEAFEEAEKIVKEGKNVKVYFLPREEAFKIPGIVKLASKLPPQIKELRIVEIEGVDIQADGGPHVKNTKEIGEIKLLKMENKGKNNRRVYFDVS